MIFEKLRVLILAGDGIHCEQETAHAFLLAKFQPEIRHLNDLIAENLTQDDLSKKYGVIAFPGGASFGDDLGAGKVLALKIQHKLNWNLNTFTARGGLVLGIANGFQALIRMGVFGSDVSVLPNANGKSLNTWTKVTPSSSRCIWLKGLGSIDLPIRQGEGKIVIESGRRMETLEKMNRQGMLCLRYEKNPNGSEENLAGLCDPTGRILGIMPHPEAFVRWTSHPEWTFQPGRASAPGLGLSLFDNAYQEMMKG